MAVQSSFKNMVLCLLVICFVSSALLAVVYAVTKAPIEAAAAAKTNNAIAQVVPAFDGTPELSQINVAGTDYTYYKVSKDGAVAGYAIMAAATGFSGPVSLMVGITADGIIYNTSVLSQSETPGACLCRPVQEFQPCRERPQSEEGRRGCRCHNSIYHHFKGIHQGCTDGS